ncbi:FAD-dependent oxidoreductase [Anaerolineae bacterium CFX7]|nr:FAD-dependent oxidoreductase [Anaerolineae bacterium CFX7]
MSAPHVLIIGAGSTGSATAHDLALRGLRVTVVERGEIASGTTGRNHCLLHSGGRYCVNDQEGAIECIEENLILRRILPHALEMNDGLFVALDDEDYAFKEKFLAGCAACHIPAREIPVPQALQIEPFLNPQIKAAVQVPDGVFEPWRFCTSFLATAKKNGATIRNFAQVNDLVFQGRAVAGAKIFDHRTGKTETIGADLVVNATGAWAGMLAAMAKVDVPVAPTAGVMVAIGKRFNNMVINRMHLPHDGDIVVPVRNTSIIGTTSWRVTKPDAIEIPQDQIDKMMQAGQLLMPILKAGVQRGVMAVARPLIASANVDARDFSRTFEAFNHRKQSGVAGLITISGGKTTTARGMAEKVSDVVCAELGVSAECKTKTTPLISYRDFYV